MNEMMLYWAVIIALSSIIILLMIVTLIIGTMMYNTYKKIPIEPNVYVKPFVFNIMFALDNNKDRFALCILFTLIKVMFKGNIRLTRYNPSCGYYRLPNGDISTLEIE